MVRRACPIATDSAHRTAHRVIAVVRLSGIAPRRLPRDRATCEQSLAGMRRADRVAAARDAVSADTSRLSALGDVHSIARSAENCGWHRRITDPVGGRSGGSPRTPRQGVTIGTPTRRSQLDKLDAIDLQRGVLMLTLICQGQPHLVWRERHGDRSGSIRFRRCTDYPARAARVAVGRAGHGCAGRPGRTRLC